MVSDTMQALALTAPGEFEVQEVPVPQAGPGEGLCEVHSVAICGTDREVVAVNFLKRGRPRSRPSTPGREWAGVAHFTLVDHGIVGIRVDAGAAGRLVQDWHHRARALVP